MAPPKRKIHPDDLVITTFRPSEGMRKALVREAKRNNRSFNLEVKARLARSLQMENDERL